MFVFRSGNPLGSQCFLRFSLILELFRRLGINPGIVILEFFAAFGGLRAAAGRFVVGVLGVLVARDLKVFYTHKFYTHAFFLDFWGFFRILRAKSIFHNAQECIFC